MWSKVEGCDNMDRVVVIPFGRVGDFVRDESSNKSCPTRFHVEARRRRASKAPSKAKVDGVLECILYWCLLGPDDQELAMSALCSPSCITMVANCM
ncbi:CUE domain-containing 5 [Cucumis melo var. makuwa]|uniref:CUE domain-containing 5 n=1 Tax=Cucumis melo var. makuwa TaxID=1194695 RepID=A0A5D3C2W2_CUCMM|nr:CUE domain-containing 5 [Cucumis melo var. makuwa]